MQIVVIFDNDRPLSCQIWGESKIFLAKAAESRYTLPRKVTNMFSIKRYEKSFREILDELDALAESLDSEALEDLNAELEDALMLLSEVKPEDGDWREELADAMEELQALAGDYRALKLPEADALARRLEAEARAALAGANQ